MRDISPHPHHDTIKPSMSLAPPLSGQELREFVRQLNAFVVIRLATDDDEVATEHPTGRWFS